MQTPGAVRDVVIDSVFDSRHTVVAGIGWQVERLRKLFVFSPIKITDARSCFTSRATANSRQHLTVRASSHSPPAEGIACRRAPSASDDYPP